jgi:hypothetical protein
MLKTVWAREHWNVGILKTRAWRNEICFYMNGTEQKIKSDHHQLWLPIFHIFTIPLFHVLSDDRNRGHAMNAGDGRILIYGKFGMT